MMRNGGGVDAHYPTFAFKSDVSYAIRIQVVGGQTTTVFVDDREIYSRSLTGGKRMVGSAGAPAHLYVNDDYTTSPNV